jgi:hypothetical protein
MLAETLLRIPFIVVGRCSLATTPHAKVKIRQNFLFLGSFRFDFTGPQAASCMHFQGRNFRFSASEKGF